MVEELHVALFHVGAADLFAGTEGIVHKAAGEDVAQFGADHGPALARLEVLEFDNFVGCAVQFDFQASAEVGGGIHAVSR